jgi:sulfite exporter TauE/SafE
MSEEENNMKWYEQLFCALPIALVSVGGAIGGLCGGLAFALNINIFSKQLSTAKKYLFTTLITLGAVICYFIILVILAIIFPETFG